MHHTPGMRGDHEIEEYMVFTCHPLLNAFSDSLELKSLPLTNEKLYSCVFLL
jgi:hypothetical protein